MQESAASRPSPPVTGPTVTGPTVTGPPWTIAQMAEAFDVTHRTIRFYEDQGLLTPERNGTHRRYHPRDRVRLGLILRGKRLGFALDEIRRIIDMYDQDVGERGQIDYLLAQIAARRAELEQRRRDIEQTLAELDDVERRCREWEPPGRPPG